MRAISTDAVDMEAQHEIPVSRQTLLAAATGLVPFLMIDGRLELAAALEDLTFKLRIASNYDVAACEVRLASLLFIASDLFVPESGCA